MLPGAVAASTTATLENRVIAPVLQQTGLLKVLQTLDQGAVAAQTPSLTLGSGSGAICLSPTTTTQNATAGQLTGGVAAVYANTFTSTDTAARPTPLGTQLIHQPNGVAAPQSFTYQVAMQPGWTLQQLDDRTVAIVDPTRPTISSEPPDPDVSDAFTPTLPADNATPTDPGISPPGDPGDPAATPDELAGIAPNPGLESTPADSDTTYGNEDTQRQMVDWATNGQAVGFITAPWAKDATGAPQLASMSTDGTGTVTFNVAHDSSSRYPTYAGASVIAMSDAARARHHVRYGISDEHAMADGEAKGGLLTDTRFKALHDSKKLPGTQGSVMQDGLKCAPDPHPCTPDLPNGTPAPQPPAGQGYPDTVVPDPWSIGHYTCSVRALFRSYPFNQVKYWGAFNEPNRSARPFGGETNSAGRKAGDVWRRMRYLANCAVGTGKHYCPGLRDKEQGTTGQKQCNAPPRAGESGGCEVIAGELIGFKNPNNQTDPFVGGYVDEIKGIHPRVWSFHPYHDVIYDAAGKGVFLQRFVNLVSALKYKPLQVWLTESGVNLSFAGGLQPCDGDPQKLPNLPTSFTPLCGNAKAQAAAATTFLKLPAGTSRTDPKDHRRLITRNYYYSWSDIDGGPGSSPRRTL